MAQTILEAIAAGMDSQTAMAVQSLLDSQNEGEATVQEDPTTVQADDDDVFQCGKCKKQFTSLARFMSHKKTRCVPAVVPLAQAPSNSQGLSPSPNTAFTPTVQQILPAQPVGNFSVPASPLPAGLNQCAVLSDDLMTFNIDPPIQTSTLQGTSLPNNTFLAQMPPLAPRSAPTASLVTLTNVGSSPATAVANSQGAFTNTTVTYTTLSSGWIREAPLGSTTAQITITNVGNSSEKPVTLPVRVQQIDDGSAANAVTLVMDEPAAIKYPQQQNKENGTVKTRTAGSKAAADVSAELNPTKRKHMCQYCDKTFSKNFDLAQHVRSHTGEKPFQCIVCGRAFAQKSNVKKHMQTHKVWPSGNSRTLPTQPVPMKVSKQGGITTDTVHIHVQKEGTNGNTAMVDVSTVEGLDNSKMNVIIDNSYLCQYCPEKFKTYFLLKTHMTKHKNEQVYKCVLKTCGETFAELDAFLEHTKTHEEHLTYRCHNCNKTFESLYDLGVHQYSHSLYPNQGPKPGPRHFRCTKCNNKYATPEALDHHQQTTTHSYPCPHCNKFFTCERYLRRHLPTHGSIGEFVCTVCGKRFKTEHYLKMHLLIHSGEKPFKCAECPAEFNRKDKLKRHQLIHEPTKRYKCPFRGYTGCTREFNRPDKLKAHIITHSGLKPYKCSTCARSFSRRSHLLEHERIHANDYKFRCAKCCRGFFRKKLLDVHRCRGYKEDSAMGDLLELPVPVRRSRRKVGRPRKRMMTVTEEIAKERSVRQMLGRRLRTTPRGSLRQADPTALPPHPTEPLVPTSHQPDLVVVPMEAANTMTCDQSGVATLTPVDASTLQPSPDKHHSIQGYMEASVVAVEEPGPQPHTMAIPVESEPLAAVTMNLDGTQTAVQVTVGEGGQLLTDAMGQVITIQPAEYTGQTGLSTAGYLEGHQVEAMAVPSDMSSALSNATLIATGPNTATLVVNTPGDFLEPIITVPQTAYVTAEQMEGLTGESVVFQTADGLIQTGEIQLQPADQANTNMQ